MPANQNEPINIAGKVVFSNPGIPSPAPAANQQIFETGASGSAADHATDALRTIAGRIPGTSVSFKNPAWISEQRKNMPEPDFQKEVTDFLSSHKRYKPTERNQLLLLEFLEDHDLELLSSNLSIAFFNLADQLDLEDPEEPPVVAPRRRVFQAFRNGRPL